MFETVPLTTVVQLFAPVMVTIYVPALTAVRFWLVLPLLHKKDVPLVTKLIPPLKGAEQLVLLLMVAVAVGNVFTATVCDVADEQALVFVTVTL